MDNPDIGFSNGLTSWARIPHPRVGASIVSYATGQRFVGHISGRRNSAIDLAAFVITYFNLPQFLAVACVMLITFWKVLIAALKKFKRDDGFPLAGNIAFSVILSAFPFLIFLTTLAGFLGDDKLAERVVVYLLSVAPASLVDPVAPEIRSLLTVPRSDLLSLSVLLTLWTASGSVRSVRVGMNRAYSLRDGRNPVLLIATDIVFVVVWAITLLALSLFIAFGPVIWELTTNWLPGVHDFTIWFDWIRFPVVFALLSVSVISAHLILPARRHLFADILPGAIFSLVMWLVIAVSYAAYLSKFPTYASTYAGLAGVIIALMYIYLSGAVLIFGGQINQAIINLRAKPVNQRSTLD